MQSTLKNRTIFGRDNIDILVGIDSGAVDLIYLDPPFNKKKKFIAPIGSNAEGAEFKDYFREEDVKNEWIKEIEEENYKVHQFLEATKAIEGRRSYNFCYLAYMAIRLIECHRVLKNTGGLYLHCDSTMSHYLKILLDCIFGEKNFRNEIIWQRNDKRGKGSQHKAKKFGANTDTIFFYAKSNDYKIAPYLKVNLLQEILQPLIKRTLDGRIDRDAFTKDVRTMDERAFEQELEGALGRIKDEALRKEYERQRKNLDLKTLKKFKNIDDTGRIYKTGTPIFRAPRMEPRPNLCFEWRGHKNPDPSGWRLSKALLEEEYQKGNVVIKSGGRLERRAYLDDYKGVPLDNNWTDIARITGQEKNGIKFPTRKPIPLLERIIETSTDRGDFVLDPFCGCATTCVAAEKLGRKWVGVDVGVKAYELVKTRMSEEIEGKTPLFWDEKITYSTAPPKRTDTGVATQREKYVYIISNKRYKGEFKVGIASNVKSRLNAYQTGDPNRAYKLEYKFLTPYFREIEQFIHEKYENRREWVRGDVKKIAKDIKEYTPKQSA